MFAVTSNSELQRSVNKSDLTGTKRRICQFIDDKRFENIADKQCIVYHSGDQYLVNWTIIFRVGDSLKVYTSEFPRKKRLFHSRKSSFDTTLFINKYSSIFNWGIDSLPEIVLKGNFEKNENAVCHNIDMYVFHPDTIYHIPIPGDKKFEHRDVELKIQKLLYLFMGLLWGEDRKSMPYPIEDLEITLPLDKW